MAWTVLLCAGVARAAADVPSSPPEDWIHDGAGLLTPSERADLAATRASLEARADLRLVVVTLASSNGEEPKSIAVRTLNAWHAGRRSALLLVVMSPRKLYLQPGTDLASTFPEATASAICGGDVAPLMRAGKKAEALRAGLEAIARQARPVEEPRREPFKAEKPNPSPEELQAKLDDFTKSTEPPSEDGAPAAGPISPRLQSATARGSGSGFPWEYGLMALGLGGGVWGLSRLFARKCQQCGTRMGSQRVVQQEATYSSSGYGEKVFTCPNCSAVETEPFTIAMLTYSSSSDSSSSDSSWSSSSSDSSSSSSSDSSSSSGSGGGGSDW